MVLPERPLTFPRASACARSTGTIFGVLWRRATLEELHRLNGVACERLDCWEAAFGRPWSDWDASLLCVSPLAGLPPRVLICAHADAAGDRAELRCAHTHRGRCKMGKKLARSRCRVSSVRVYEVINHLT